MLKNWDDALTQVAVDDLVTPMNALRRQKAEAGDQVII